MRTSISCLSAHQGLVRDGRLFAPARVRGIRVETWWRAQARARQGCLHPTGSSGGRQALRTPHRATLAGPARPKGEEGFPARPCGWTALREQGRRGPGPRVKAQFFTALSWRLPEQRPTPNSHSLPRRLRTPGRAANTGPQTRQCSALWPQITPPDTQQLLPDAVQRRRPPCKILTQTRVWHPRPEEAFREQTRGPGELVRLPYV